MGIPCVCPSRCNAHLKWEPPRTRRGDRTHTREVQITTSNILSMVVLACPALCCTTTTAHCGAKIACVLGGMIVNFPHEISHTEMLKVECHPLHLCRQADCVAQATTRGEGHDLFLSYFFPMFLVLTCNVHSQRCDVFGGSCLHVLFWCGMLAHHATCVHERWS